MKTKKKEPRGKMKNSNGLIWKNIICWKICKKKYFYKAKLLNNKLLTPLKQQGKKIILLNLQIKKNTF